MVDQPRAENELQVKAESRAYAISRTPEKRRQGLFGIVLENATKFFAILGVLETIVVIGGIVVLVLGGLSTITKEVAVVAIILAVCLAFVISVLYGIHLRLRNVERQLDSANDTISKMKQAGATTTELRGLLEAAQTETKGLAAQLSGAKGALQNVTKERDRLVETSSAQSANLAKLEKQLLETRMELETVRLRPIVRHRAAKDPERPWSIEVENLGPGVAEGVNLTAKAVKQDGSTSEWNISWVGVMTQGEQVIRQAFEKSERSQYKSVTVELEWTYGRTGTDKSAWTWNFKK